MLFIKARLVELHQGTITVESQPDALDAGDEARCLAALCRALAFCRQHRTTAAVGHSSKLA